MFIKDGKNNFMKYASKNKSKLIPLLNNKTHFLFVHNLNRLTKTKDKLNIVEWTQIIASSYWAIKFMAESLKKRDPI